MKEPVLRATVGVAASVALLFAGALSAPWLHAQPRSASPATGPAFDAASVKPNKSGQQGGSNTFLPGGRYVGANVTLRRVVGLAYLPLLGIQIIGGPAWINSEPFDIEAKAEGNPSADELRLMLRTLLADRFTLRVHSETRESPVYALVMARSDGRMGPKLIRSSVDCAAASGRGSAPPPSPPSNSERPTCGMRTSPGNLTAGAVPVALLLNILGPFVNRPILNRTGLIGSFDIDLTWTPDQPLQRPPGADEPPSIRMVRRSSRRCKSSWVSNWNRPPARLMWS